MSVAADGGPKAALSPADAGPEYALQGEYVGELVVDGVTVRVGVQVIAIGNGKFRTIGYVGGLPGDGWDGTPKIEQAAELRDGAVVIENAEYAARVQSGRFVVQLANGTNLGELTAVKRESPTLGQNPPPGAVVLFDGKSAESFDGGRISPEGWLEQGATSKAKFQNFSLHLEFMLPFKPEASGQERGNSGCYAQGRYEVQILDSFGLLGLNNECGGIYGIRSPNVNMCYPPLSWQTYDIDFTAATFDASGTKTTPAKMTVKHNGTVIHRDVKLPSATTAAPVAEGDGPGPLYLQDHGNPVRFRNIWVVEKN